MGQQKDNNRNFKVQLNFFALHRKELLPEKFEGHIYTFELFDRATFISLSIIVLSELS